MGVIKIKIPQGESKKQILRLVSEEIATAGICMTKSVVEELKNQSYIGFEGTEISYSLELEWFENALKQMITIRNSSYPNEYWVNSIMLDGERIYPQNSPIRIVFLEMDS